jgi:hypothetical protein
MRRWLTAVVFIGSLVWHVSPAAAQSSIAGVVKDGSGGVLPGVTVEASSPALIEGTRVSTTDGSGQYQLTDLRPGVYSVTFTLTGFSVLRREGIQLPAAFTATVNAELTVGALEETLTVTGQSPVVDTRSSVSQSVMSRETLDTIPTGRDVWSAGQLIAGMTTSSPDVGGTKGMQQPTLQVHGSASSDNTYQQDGVTIQHVAFSGNQTGFYYNDGDVEEVVYRTSALPAESAYGGVQINMVPREGGNAFKGAIFMSGATKAMQSNNVDEDLIARGLTAANSIDNVYDTNLSLGGPIKRDKLWFFGTFRRWGANTFVANTFNPDRTQALDDNRLTNAAVRTTWQVTSQNKLNLFYSHGAKWRGHRRGNNPGGTVFVEPVATVVQTNPRNYIAQAKWYSTVTDRVLVEAGAVVMPVDYNLAYQPEVGPTDLAELDLITGVLSKAAPWDTVVTGTMETYAASVSYVPGSHNIKAGFQARGGFFQEAFRVNEDILLRFRNGVPDSVITYNTPVTRRDDLHWEVGFYLQDSFTYKRLSLNPGVRFDHLAMGWPEQNSPGGTYAPARSFPAVEGLVDWNSVVPRLGVAYDVFGNGKTALKGNISKYMKMEGTSLVSQVNPNQRASNTRSWNDVNSDRRVQPNELGPSTGFVGGGVTRRIDPDLKWPYQWEWSFSLDHELMERLAISVGYYGRKYSDLYAIRNLAVPPSAYIPVTITNPLTNEPLTVYNQDPSTIGLVDQLVTTIDDLFQDYHGFEAKVNKRLTRGSFFVGFTVGRNRGTGGGDRNNPNNLINDIGAVGFDSPYQVRAGGSYVMPGQVRLSGSVRTSTGLPLNRNFIVGRAQVPNLTQVSQTVQLVPRGEVRLDRFDLLDLRVSKIFGSGTRQIEALADVFNVLNNNATTGEVQTVGSSLGRPSEIIGGRLLRLGLQIKF